MKLNLKLNIKAANQIEKEIISKTILNNQREEEVKNECSLILDNIFLSNYKIANDKNYLMSNEITHVVNSASQSRAYTPQFFEEIRYLLLNMRDEPDYDLISEFYKCIEFLEKTTKGGRKVLVHCYEGKSRGPAIIISYLMWKYKFSFDYTYDYVKSKRPCIDINIGFVSQLKKWGELLLIRETSYIYGINTSKSFKIFYNGLIRSEELHEYKTLMFPISTPKYIELETEKVLSPVNQNTFMLFKILIVDETDTLDCLNAESDILNQFFRNNPDNEFRTIVKREDLERTLRNMSLLFTTEELYNCFF